MLPMFADCRPMKEFNVMNKIKLITKFVNYSGRIDILLDFQHRQHDTTRQYTTLHYTPHKNMVSAATKITPHT